MSRNTRVWTAGLGMVALTAALAWERPWREDPEREAGFVWAQMSEPGRLDAAYTRWREAHEARSGDRAVVLSLGWAKGLSREFTRAHGRATLDLIDGAVSVELESPGDADVGDVWLVDNQPGPGHSVAPDPGDRLLHAGALQRQGDRATLQADLGAAFDSFDVDLVVVTRAGTEPTEGGLLFGAPGLFQRIYTAARTGRTPLPDREPAPARPILGAGVAQANHIPMGLVESFDPLIKRGADLFFNETFKGNGRTCGTCHPSENNFTIDPEFIAKLHPRDPLFVAEFVPALAENFEKPELMRKAGLILENVDGMDDLENKFVLRGVPHTLALGTSMTPAPGGADGSTTPPEQRTGWSGDGAPGNGTLREFAIGAVTQHFPKTTLRRPGIDFRLPTDSELDAMEAFQLFLGRDEELELETLELTGEVPARGQEIFLANDTQGGTVAAGKCNFCHANAGASVSFLPGANANFNLDTGVERLRDTPADLIDAENTRPDGGFGRAPHPSVPGAFGDGAFNTPTLVEAADTGPFFHDNSVETIEQAVAFYNSAAFNESPAAAFVRDSAGVGISLEPTQVVAVAAFLRVINALENIRSAKERSEFAQATYSFSSARSILELAIDEVEDAIEVLDCGGLHPEAQKDLRSARLYLDYAYDAYYKWTQEYYTGYALSYLRAARRELARD